MKAKTKFTRLWSILLALVMVVGMLPTVALAAESQTADFYADPTTALALLNAAKTEGAADSTWDGNTLTLNGVNFTTTAAIAVKLPDGAKIVLADNTVNTINGGNSGSGDCYGIYTDGSLTISGSGTLDVTGGTATGEEDNSYGIYVENMESSLTISGSGKLNATGGDATGQYGCSCGIYAKGRIAISGNVTAKGGTATNGSSCGIDATNGLSISGTATVTATGGTAGSFSYGINVLYNTMSISGGTVYAEGGGTSSRNNFGIYAYTDLTISGDADVTAKGGTATNDSSYGIYASAGLTISGTAKVKATGGTAKDYSYGIYEYNSYGSISVSGTAKVNATGGEATKDSYGIYSYGDTKISGGTTRVTAIGGTVNATGGTAGSGYDSCGICANKDVIIENGIVTATGGTATDDSYGICAYNNVTIKSGTVNATGGAAQMTEYSVSGGIHGSYSITIEDGIVEATGGAAWVGCGFSIAALGNMYIYDGTVTATGGTATSGSSYGIYTEYSAFVTITGGSLIAKAGSAPSAKALPWAPNTLPSTYWWRSSDSGQYKKGSFNWGDVSTYVEIGDTEPITTYTVTFDANGGTGTMTDVTGVLGDYTLPANGFTAPEGKQFKCWSVDGNEKAVGDKITVTANTTVKAVWENITYTVSFDSNGGTGTMTTQTGVLGDYTLPENGFTAPAGKQFKAWSVNGNEKAVGDKIAVAADTTVKAVWENIPAAPTEYNILDGANSKWTQDSDGNLSVRGSGEFSKFVGVKVDGKSVDEKYYTVKEGSTIVTLKTGYLNTLTVGSHTLEIIWTDGTAGTAFTVNAKAVVDNDTKSPQTGDNNSIALWIALLFVSAAGVFGTAVLWEKKQNQAE